MDSARVADVLQDIATLLSLKGENPFKVRAFENAARAVSDLPDLPARVAAGTLLSVDGIGKGTGEVIRELVLGGRSALREDLRRELPDGLLEMLRVPGLGPKKALALHRELGVSSLGELEYAIGENRLVSLPGFGQKTQEKIAGGLSFVRSRSGRYRLADAAPRAERLAELLRGLGEAAGLSGVAVAGDVRRHLEVVERIDLVVACERPALVPAPPSGPGDPPVRIVTCRPAELGTALVLATGSAGHLQALAARGFPEVVPSARTEEDVYAALGLPFIPPELRESGREVTLAAEGRLPRLVEPADIRGPFHVHSTWSDGRATLEQTFTRLVELGYEYVGISDHSPAAAYARGLTPDRLALQRAEIASLRPRFPSLTVFCGTEADILPDGSVDYGDDLLGTFDFVIASVHSAFHLPRAEQTARLVAAVRNPRVTLLGHATGRLLLSRKGIDVDLPAVLEAAAEAGTGVETNASPYRLELDWRLGETARSLGVFTSVNPDAHSLDDLLNVRWGVGVARKAGFSREEVLNAGSAAEVAERLAALRARA